MSLKALKTILSRNTNLCGRVHSSTGSSFYLLAIIYTDALNILFVNFGVNLNLFPQHVFLEVVLEKNVTIFKALHMYYATAF